MKSFKNENASAILEHMIEAGTITEEQIATVDKNVLSDTAKAVTALVHTIFCMGHSVELTCDYNTTGWEETTKRWWNVYTQKLMEKIGVNTYGELEDVLYQVKDIIKASIINPKISIIMNEWFKITAKGV